MAGTYPCTWAGCNLVFKREFQHRKHMATHEDPARVHNCLYCAFYTLDPRNLDTHIAGHTGEKRHECPDGTTESPCDYRTHDRSLLTKHRTKIHNYIPRGRAAHPQPPANFTFVSSVAVTTTKNTISVREREEKSAKIKSAKERAVHKAKKEKGRAMQDPLEPCSMSQDDLDSLFDEDTASDSAPVAGSSSAASSEIQSVPVIANQGDSSKHGQYIPQDQYGSIAPMAPQQGISSSYTTAYNTVAPSGSQQDTRDEDAGFVNYGTTHAGYNNAMDQLASHNDAPLGQEHIYGYMDFTGWDFAGTSSDAMPATWDSNTHALSAYAIQQDTQGQSAYGTESALTAPDQGMTGLPLQPAPNDDWHAAGSTSTQLLPASDTPSNEPSTRAKDVEDYLDLYPEWLPKAAWDDMWAQLKQLVSDGNIAMYSARADELENYFFPVPDRVPNDFDDRTWAP